MRTVAIFDNTVPPGFPGPVRHRHTSMTDIFYVLEGELSFDLGGEWRSLGPGSFVLVPPGVVHTFANRGSALKEAFKRMVEGHPWSPAEMAEVAARYDFEPVAEEG
ncbi:MAG: hypothetical protein K0S14_3524 [Thermomicrobiales bacterium]|nr:hypothetical protein [Thermomicrobiales bacterium]